MFSEVNAAQRHIIETHGTNPPPGTYAVPYPTHRGDAFLRVELNDKLELGDFSLFWDEAFTKPWRTQNPDGTPYDPQIVLSPQPFHISHVVFGLTPASYDTQALGLYAIKAFDEADDAADWLTAQYAEGPIRSGIYSFNQCVILQQFELAKTDQ